MPLPALPSNLLSAATVAERAGVPYDTLMHWLRRGIVQATLYRGKAWHATGFTETEAAEVESLAIAVRYHRQCIADLLAPKRGRRAA